MKVKECRYPSFLWQRTARANRTVFQVFYMTH